MDLESLLRDQKQRTIYCGNLTPDVTEEILYELFLQAGPLEDIVLKRSNNYHFGFVRYKHHESVDYALRLFKGVTLFGNKLRIERKIGAETTSLSQGPRNRNRERAALAGNTPIPGPASQCARQRSRSGERYESEYPSRRFQNSRYGAMHGQIPPRFRNRSAPRPSSYSSESERHQTTSRQYQSGRTEEPQPSGSVHGGGPTAHAGSSAQSNLDQQHTTALRDLHWPVVTSANKLPRKRGRRN